MHVQTMLDAVKHNNNPKADEVEQLTSQLVTKSNQSRFNAKTADKCELMPESTKEALRQGAEDDAAVLGFFVEFMGRLPF